MASLRNLPNMLIKKPGFESSVDGAPYMEREPGKRETHRVEGSGDRPHQLLMAGFEALDLVNVGVAVVNVYGQLLLANRNAEQVLESRDGISLTARGVLRASGSRGTALSMLLRQVGNPGPQRFDTGEGILAVERPSGKRPFTLLVRPVEASLPPQDSAEPTVLVFILDPEFAVEMAESELRQLYGLTSTESSMAQLLMEGKTLDDCCVVLGIRRSTARTHLQHLFEKVGVQRQSELVSLLLKSIGLVRSRNKAKKAHSFLRSAIA